MDLKYPRYVFIGMISITVFLNFMAAFTLSCIISYYPYFLTKYKAFVSLLGRSSMVITQVCSASIILSLSVVLFFYFFKLPNYFLILNPIFQIISIALCFKILSIFNTSKSEQVKKDFLTKFHSLEHINEFMEVQKCYNTSYDRDCSTPYIGMECCDTVLDDLIYLRFNYSYKKMKTWTYIYLASFVFLVIIGIISLIFVKLDKHEENDSKK